MVKRQISAHFWCLVCYIMHICTKAGCNNMQYNINKHYYDPYLRFRIRKDRHSDSTAVVSSCHQGVG